MSPVVSPSMPRNGCAASAASAERNPSSAARPAIICSQPFTVGSVASARGTVTTYDTVDDSPGALCHV